MPEPLHTNEELLPLAAKGDKAAQEQLITQNTGLVHSVVRRFMGRGAEPEDLFQIGCIGLIRAVQKFDCSFGVKFSTYAVPMIMGEIKRFLRDDGMIKVSRSVRDTAAKSMRARELLQRRLGREPTLQEVAAELALSPEAVSSAMDAACPPESLYSIDSRSDGKQTPLLEKIPSDVDYAAAVTDKLALRQLMKTLPAREQTLLTLRYFRRQTQTQVAEQLGISQVQVSRIEKKLLRTLREQLII